MLYEELKKNLIEIFKKNTDLITNDNIENVKKRIIIETNIEFSKGHIATNILILIAKKENIDKEKIITLVKQITLIKEVYIDDRGFIILTLNDIAWYSLIAEINAKKENFGLSKSEKKSKINIEYISANPTGPMHSGHQRIADLGYIIYNCLKYNNYNIISEFYWNDAGSQIDKFGESVYIRYLENLNRIEDHKLSLEYKGEYLYDIAKDLEKKYGKELNISSDKSKITKTSLNIMKDKIIEFIKQLNIKFDIFTSEKQLRNDNKIEKAIKILNKYIYKGELESLEDKNSKSNNLLLFKTTEFGDSQDRTIQKSDGEYTYFGAEIAYFLDKIERGFTELIMIVGHDHIGCKARWEATVKALNDVLNVNVQLKLIFTQLVKYIDNGKIIDMSKRKGSFISAQQMVSTLGKDSVRIFLLSSRYNTEIKFDFEKVKSAQNSNPVFYIQYAYVRTCSIFRQLKRYKLEIAELDSINIKLDQLEIKILRILAMWPKIIEKTINTLEPYTIIDYMIKLSKLLHSMWNTDNYKIIDINNHEQTQLRLHIIKSIQNTLKSGFKILDVTPKEEI